jgi:large subunit ribosomal protein L17
MRHKKLNKRFGRNMSQRKQLLRSIVRSLFLSYSIETTVQKAKQAKKIADNIITYAKTGTLNDIRAMERILQDRALIAKIIKEIAPLSKERKGGYTRIIHSGFRRGDGADLAVLQLTDMPEKQIKHKKQKKIKSKGSTDQAIDDTKSEKSIQQKKSDTAKKQQGTDTGKGHVEVAEKSKDKKEQLPKDKGTDKKPKREKLPKGKKDMLGKFRKFFRNKAN